jgi:hypothetical protein
VTEDAKANSDPARQWGRIRSWDGSQHRAFEELCFQLRDPAPARWRTVKTAAPDAGLEWYDQAPDGTTHGWQVKFVFSVDNLIPQARKSAKTVGANRGNRNVVRLTIVAPIDMPDPAPETPKGQKRVGARQRWNNAVARWRKDLPGLADMEIDFLGAGELLDRLNRPGNEGRRWFFFEDLALSPPWCRQQFTHAERIAGDRYTPDRHLTLPIDRTIDGLVLTERYRRTLTERLRSATDSVSYSQFLWHRWLQRHDAKASADPADTEPLGPAASRWVLPTERIDRAAATMTSLRDEFDGLDASVGPAAEAAVRVASECDDLLTQFRSSLTDVVAELKASATSMDFSEDRDVTSAPSRPTPVEESEDPVTSLQEMVGAHGQFAQAQRSLRNLVDFLSADRSKAAETGAWLLIGGPGQGKTHLLLEAVRSRLDNGGVAVPVLGELLVGDDPLTEIARALGLGDLPHDTFLQALDAAGATSGTRFLLVIDALNDSEKATQWRSRLSVVLSRLADFEHVAVAFSCRSTMRTTVLPADLDQLGLPVTDHPGFRGREAEGLEVYLRDVPHALPRTPLLHSSFGNPLFVKLYAATLRSRVTTSGTPARISGTHHRSEVFRTFLDSKSDEICEHLGLDPSTRPVHTAVQALANVMASTGHDVLPREDARNVVDAFAPQATTWPKTMLGQLISRGVLATDRYHTHNGVADVGVGFPYQAFSDDLIVRAALESRQSDLVGLPTGTPLPVGSSLRQWLMTASPNLLEAASVILPELAGTELIDALDAIDSKAAEDEDDHHQRWRRRELFRALVETLPLRVGADVTERTRTLINTASQAHHLSDAVLDSIIAVSTEPDHLLNAQSLNRTLTAVDAVSRDAIWGVYAYHAYSEVGPLHRLLRWAEQVPTPQRLLPSPATPPRPLTARRAGTRAQSVDTIAEPSAEVVELAAIVLTWTLTSSNRFLRDRATKALVQLLLGFPDVLSTLLDRFLREQVSQVADVYLFSRLLVVTEGVVLRTGHAQPAKATGLARQVYALVHDDPDSPAHISRSVLLCDAACGVIAAARRLTPQPHDDLPTITHPHHAPEPGEAPSAAEVDERFPRSTGAADAQNSWGRLRSSLDGALGDFGRYRVSTTVTRFTRLPLDRNRPASRAIRDERPRELDPDHVAAFRESLPEFARDVLTNPAAVRRLLDKKWIARQVLDDDQYRLLNDCPVPPPVDEALFNQEQDADQARRWILARVDELGWTPQLFGSFDQYRPHSPGYAQAHKGERIGKKFQWIALHDLLERLANHYHLADHWGTPSTPYRGGWELDVRDIDPSLPPASHRLPDQDDEDDTDDHPTVGHTFAPSDTTASWAPPVPRLPAADAIDDWIHDGGTAPRLEDIALRVDSDGTPWVVLGEFVKDTPDGRGFDGDISQAEQWHAIDSWLVTKRQSPHVKTFLEGRSLIPRWMPDEPEPRGIYLSEYPDAEPARELDHRDDESCQLRHTDFDAARAATPPRADEDDDLIDQLHNMWRPTETTLEELVVDWAGLDENDAPDRTIAHRDFTDLGVDDTRTPLRAFPATTDYFWEGSGVDCSINESVSVRVPTNLLLRGSGLVRHPDRAEWYNREGTLVFTYHWGDRPTGEVKSLLVRQDWLAARLNQLGYDLFIGLMGELQVTKEIPDAWRQFSQSARFDGSNITSDSPLTTLRRKQH